METKSVSIAVLGPSTAGKTTYITALCDAISCGEILQNRAKGNNRGQTKIVCYYHFVNVSEVGAEPIDIGISQIFIYREKLVADDSEVESIDIENLNEPEKKLLKLLSVTNEMLRSYAQENNFLVCIPVKLGIKEIAQLDKGEYAEIIHHIVVEVQGSELLLKYLTEYKIHDLTIRDVMGFGDDRGLDSELGEIQKDSKKRASCYGYEDVDAIILFNIKGGTFSGSRGKVYTKVLEDALALKPVTVLHRSELLLDALLQGEKYNDFIKNKNHTLWRTGAFNFVNGIIDAIIDKNQANVYSDIIREYIQFLFIADANLNDAECKKIYNESVYQSFYYFLGNLCQFNEVVSDMSTEGKETLLLDLEDHIRSQLELPQKFVNCLEKNSWYSMVGTYGGLTTRIAGQGRVGQTVIDVMDNIYNIVRGYVGERWRCKAGQDGLTIEQQQQVLLYSIADKLLHSGDKFLDWRSTLYPTSKESIVRNAFNNTCKQVQESEGIELNVVEHFTECIIDYISGCICSICDNNLT